ncbi:MAG: hypothetical protein PVH02_15025 [Desulfobacteraceae bacterium]
MDYAFERSFKVTEKTLLGNRILYGVYTEKIKEDQHKELLDICHQMNMPEAFFENFREDWRDTNAIGWAFEKIGEALVYKVYLEFWDKWKKEIKETPNERDPFLVVLGFKWDALNRAKRSLARYTWYPLLSYEEMLERLSGSYENDQYRSLFGIIKDFLRFPSIKVTHDEIRYIEVTEENTPRRSFDINVYNAKLQLKEVYPLLQKIYQHYSIPDRDFHTLYNQFRTKIIGHLSGGIGRDGKDFLTVYYGLEEVVEGK